MSIGQLQAVHSKTHPRGPDAKTALPKKRKNHDSERMTAEAILQKSVRYDRVGNPLEVVIPYEDFIDFVETYGLDLSAEEKEAIREAKADREAGRTENFVALDDIERELGF